MEYLRLERYANYEIIEKECNMDDLIKYNDGSYTWTLYGCVSEGYYEPIIIVWFDELKELLVLYGSYYSYRW